MDIYGKATNFKGSSDDCSFRYQGQYEDVETGLYYNRFRYYSPDEGMYMSQDPIRLSGNNPTLYAYTKDVNTRVDVFGLSDCQFANGIADHLKYRDMSVPRKRGIGGAHNLDEFMKHSSDFKIVKVTDHPTIPGVQHIEYQMASLDKFGKQTGEYNNKIFEKTVYDPSIVSDAKWNKWGTEAAEEAKAAGRMDSGYDWIGTSSDGVEMMGYVKDELFRQYAIKKHNKIERYDKIKKKIGRDSLSRRSLF